MCVTLHTRAHVTDSFGRVLQIEVYLNRLDSRVSCVHEVLPVQCLALLHWTLGSLISEVALTAVSLKLFVNALDVANSPSLFYQNVRSPKL